MLNETTANYVRSRISDERTLNASEYDPTELISLEQ